ncbi:hypothetical protein LPN01_17530 [Sphingomonas sp. A2-49]|uniref:hypothetical protein n=1 Tax=Sphingomonas sp. A2-49 TaxID=1391375 RepID=UPI0021CDF4DC|nr:hypothetical protein [Sphingomonas sp. A2-49]MCU6455883.1 hypothetical protein [Sphingomonas sp. A2-49]
MNALMKKAGLGIALAATALTAAAPAEAQRWGGYRHYNRGGNTAAGALLGGIVGLGIGAAIASSNRDGYYDRGYRGYYDAPPPPRVVYRDRYYAPPPRVVVRERYYDYAPQYDYGYRGDYGYGYGY